MTIVNLRWLLAGIGTLLASSAMAQDVRYTCRSPSGNLYQLSRPCPQIVPEAVLYDTPDRESGRPPARMAARYEDYMSPRCLTLMENLRSGTRRSSAEVSAGLRREYERDCRVEESEAQSRFYREQRDAQTAKNRAQRQDAIAQQTNRNEETRKSQQCVESRRILAAKKARTDLTPGELNDLRRFESNIVGRCGES